MSTEKIVEGLEGVIAILRGNSSLLNNISSRVAALEEEHCKGINVRRDQESANASFRKRLDLLDSVVSTSPQPLPKINNEWMQEKADEIAGRLQAIEDDIESKSRCFSDDLDSVKSDLDDVPNEDTVKEWAEEAIKEMSREDFLEVLGGKAVRAEIQFVPE